MLIGFLNKSIANYSHFCSIPFTGINHIRKANGGKTVVSRVLDQSINQ